MTITLPYVTRIQPTGIYANIVSIWHRIQLSSKETLDSSDAIEPNKKSKSSPKKIKKTSINNEPNKAKKPKKKPTKKSNKSTKKEAVKSKPQLTTTEPELNKDSRPQEKKSSRVLLLASQTQHKVSTTVKGKLALPKPFAKQSINEINSNRKKYGLATLIAITPVVSLIAIYISPLLGTYINAITLAILATIAIANENLRKLSISVAILPIIQLFNLSVPQDDLLLRTVIFYSLLLLLTLTYRYLFTLDAPKRRIPLNAIIAFQALLITMILFGQWQYEALQTYFPFGINSGALTVFIFILLAIIEEVYFRGLVQANAISEVGKNSSVIIASLLFGFSFLGPDMPLSLIFGLIFGVLLSTLYVIRRSLILNIAANMLSKILLIGLLTIFR